MIVLGYEVPPELLERLEARMRGRERFRFAAVQGWIYEALRREIGHSRAFQIAHRLADRVIQSYRRRGLIEYRRPWWRWVGGAS